MKVKDYLKEVNRRNTYAEKMFNARMKRALAESLAEVIEVSKYDILGLEARLSLLFKRKPIEDALKWLYVDWAFKNFKWFKQNIPFGKKDSDDLWLEKLEVLFKVKGAEKVTEIAGTTLELAKPVIKEAIAKANQGLSIDKIQKYIQDGLSDIGGPISAGRARMIARTEVVGASNMSTYESVRSTNVEVEKKWVTGGMNIRHTHKQAEKQGWIPFDEAFKVGNHYMDHPGAPSKSGVPNPEEVINCYLPNTEIKSVIIGAQKSFYSGQVVEIITVGGKRLTVTPNHHILTINGMIRAIDLNKGDYLLCNTEKINRGIFIKRNNIDNKETFAANIFNTLQGFWGSYFRPVIHLDFDGDGRNINGDVNIINPNINLMSNSKIFTKDFNKFDLKQSNSKSSLIKRFCSFYFGGNRMFCASNSLMSFLNLSFTFRFSHFTPFKFAGFGLTSKHYAVFNQMPIDSRSINSNDVSNIIRAYPSIVHIDNIIDIKYSSYSGHVYDFSSLSGINIANNIYTSNCKCILIFRGK